MSTCLACPPLSCDMDCEASKQLVSTLACEATSYPEPTTINPASAIEAIFSSLGITSVNIDQLPNEIKDQIVSYLQPDLESIRNIRLVSKSWAFLGSPYLLSPTLTALPHRDDFTRLVEVAQHPYFSQQIRTLNIRWMTIDEESLRLDLISPHAGFSYDEESSRTSWGQYRKMKGLVDLYSDTFCNKVLLTQAFLGLTQLKELNVNPDSYLFEKKPINTYLYDAWSARRSYGYRNERNRGAENRRHYYEIFSALNAAKSANLRTLTCDPFSHIMWEDRQTENYLAPILQTLTCLKLNIDCSRAPGLDEQNTIPQHEIMGQCLSRATQLEQLYISGNGGYRTKRTLPIALEGVVFPRLHTLVLDECGWQLPVIHAFLYNHRGSLRRVRLESHVTRQVANWEQDIRALLDIMKTEMQLEKLDYRGEFGSQRAQTQLAIDVLGAVDGIWDDEWRPRQRPTNVWNGLMAKRIEDYVMRDGPLPVFVRDI